LPGKPSNRRGLPAKKLLFKAPLSAHYELMPLALIILVLAAGWRLVALHDPALSNFSPMMALAFCGGVYLRNRWQQLAPFLALALTDLYIDRFYALEYGYHWSLGGAVVRLLCFAAALGFGLLVARRRSWLSLLNGALGGAFLFYLVTNTASWLGDAGYAKSAAGLWQALTVGHPGFPPTLAFFRNSLVSDLLFTGLFAGAVEIARLRRGEFSLLASRQNA